MSTFASAAASASSTAPKVSAELPIAEAGPSTAQPLASPSTKGHRIDTLILDAGALIMRAPLAGLASEYYIPPQVIDELKHASGREYLASLRLNPDFVLHVVQPSPASMVAVSDFARQTGDIAVLSRQDLEVIALTYERELHRHGAKRIRTRVGGLTGKQVDAEEKRKSRQAQLDAKRLQKDTDKQRKLEQEASLQGCTVEALAEQRKKAAREQKAARKQKRQEAKLSQAEQANDAEVQQGTSSAPHEADEEPEDSIAPTEELLEEAQAEEDSDSDSDDGDWITPDNVQKAKHFSLGLVSDTKVPGWKYPKPSNALPEPADALDPQEPLEEGWERVESGKGKVQANGRSHISADYNNPSIQSRPSAGLDRDVDGHMTVACITGDFAVQNVLLQMGLSLVGVHGARIRSVKSYVLRCHACMKVCKDMEKKFCPSCGNATLTKVAVTVTDGAAAANGTGGLKLHLKKNYQYNLRGSKYSIPAPKPGSASGGKTGGSGLILREDQVEWQRALAKEDSRRRKEERNLTKAMMQGKDSLSQRYQEAWDNSGDTFLTGQFAPQNRPNLPVIGHGRKNPNANRRSRK